MAEILIRECNSLAEFDSCIRLQREVFGLRDLEVSPQRHLIVSRQAGGWTLGAFVSDEAGDERLVGFVHHLAAVFGQEIFGYSHMMAVAFDYQNRGVGARLKWSQRARALAESRQRIRWTWDPMQARNAYFNLHRLGVVVASYAENFYGTDYLTTSTSAAEQLPGIDSDRIFADWRIRSQRVTELAENAAHPETTSPIVISATPSATITIPAEWTKLVAADPQAARQELLRVRSEFQTAFAAGLVAADFHRSSDRPQYLLYDARALESVLGFAV